MSAPKKTAKKTKDVATEQEVEVQPSEQTVSATELLEKMKREGKSYVRIQKLF